MPIVVIATLAPKPEHRDDVRDALITAVEQSQAEDACQLHALHEGPDNFSMVEQWASQEALQAHGAKPAVAELKKRLDGKVVAPLQLTIVQPIPVGDLRKGQLRP